MPETPVPKKRGPESARSRILRADAIATEAKLERTTLVEDLTGPEVIDGDDPNAQVGGLAMFVREDEIHAARLKIATIYYALGTEDRAAMLRMLRA